ncbi:uncharacterized protein LOC135693943 [Rhopilema esculentum]|uniref:uncharacterized protein LOC135693943 n=1 Tax=Rhopilema esculentum TaxID=499914 RepID=UPI0031D913A3
MVFKCTCKLLGRFPPGFGKKSLGATIKPLIVAGAAHQRHTGNLGDTFIQFKIGSRHFHSSNAIYSLLQKHKREIAQKKPKSPQDGPEPSYERISFSEEKFYHHHYQFICEHGGVLPNITIAFETWGKLNRRKDNAVLIFSGLSGSSHAKSHQGVENSRTGWWENFIGPGGKIDTEKYFVICANHLGGCFGTTGPSSINPNTKLPYGGDFPIISVKDLVDAQFLLIDHLGIKSLHAVVGSSLGGMASLLAASLYPQRIKKMVSISAAVSAHPTAIAFRYIQRQALMSDPAWRRGHYYSKGLPVRGMQLARKIATLTYRSGPEWNERFGRKRVESSDIVYPRLDVAEFEIEDYIRHQGENFFQKSQYDPNSLLYLTKAMDLFDLSVGYNSMEESVARMKMPCLIMGASSDLLFPATQQVELAELLKSSGNENVTLILIEGKYGHDTFLLDVEGMGTHTKMFLETH